MAGGDLREWPARLCGTEEFRNDRDRPCFVLGHLVGSAAQPERLEATGAPPADDDEVGADVVGRRQEGGSRDADHHPVFARPAPFCTAGAITFVGDAHDRDPGAGGAAESLGPRLGHDRSGRSVVTHEQSGQLHRFQS